MASIMAHPSQEQHPEEEQENLDVVRLRFQSHLPKYGNLWKSMAPPPPSSSSKSAPRKKPQEQEKPNQPKREPFFSLLPAIENRQTVTFNVNMKNCTENGEGGTCLDGEDCINCAPPIYEEIDYNSNTDHNTSSSDKMNHNATSSNEDSDDSDDDSYECDFNLSRVCDEDDKDVKADDEKEQKKNCTRSDSATDDWVHAPENKNTEISKDMKYRIPASQTSLSSSDDDIDDDDSSSDNDSSFECDFNLSRVCGEDDNNNDANNEGTKNIFTRSDGKLNNEMDDNVVSHDGFLVDDVSEKVVSSLSTETTNKSSTKELDGTYRDNTNHHDDNDEENTEEGGEEENDSFIDNAEEDEDEDSVCSGNTILAARKTPRKVRYSDDMNVEASPSACVENGVSITSSTGGDTIGNTRKTPKSKIVNTNNEKASDDMYQIDFKSLSISNTTNTPTNGKGTLKNEASSPLSKSDDDDEQDFLPEASPFQNKSNSKEHKSADDIDNIDFKSLFILDNPTKSSISNTPTNNRSRNLVKSGKSSPLVSDDEDLLLEASPFRNNTISSKSTSIEESEVKIKPSSSPVQLVDNDEDEEESKGASSSENEWDEQSEASENGESNGPNPEFSVIILSDDDEIDEDDNDDEDFLEDEISISDESNVSEEELNENNGFDRVNRKGTPRRKKQQELLPPSISEKEHKTKTARIPRKTKEMSKASFKRARDGLTSKTFAEFNDIGFDKKLKDVKVTWSSHLRTTAGLTRLKKITKPNTPPSRIATIELSTKIIDENHRLRSTLLHEMCHAAAWLVDGVAKPPHGACFKKWAKHSMKKIRDVIVTTTHSYEIAYKYAWACTTPKCGVVIKRHSRSVNPNKQCCGRCKGTLVEIEVPTAGSSVKNVEHTPRKKKALSGFNLFVQERSKSVRAKLQSQVGPKVTQSEVMKECARLWREQKQGQQVN